MDTQTLKQQVEQIRWFHTMDLGHGVITQGYDRTPKKLKGLHLPADFSGKSVLDIGAWDGFFSFEAERRGASRVLAVDSFSWNGSNWGSKAGFELARKVYQSKVEDKELDVFQICPQTVGQFDVVFFLGVLYHMKHPLQTLERVAEVSREMLILETQVDLVDTPVPAMAYYPNTELNGDPTNWWAPNPACLEEMLRTVGFTHIEFVRSPRSRVRRFTRALVHSLRGKTAFRSYQQDRVVVHAWK